PSSRLLLRRAGRRRWLAQRWRRCGLRRLSGRRRHPRNIGRWRRQRPEFRREELIELIDWARRRRGPRARPRELPIEVLHLAPHIVDHAFVVELVRDDARRDEHDELGAIVLDVLLAE